MVKQEIARANILGIGKLKRTEMGEFNSGYYCIYYCGKESLERNGVAIIVNKIVQSAMSKQQNDLCSFLRQTIQYYGIQVYAPTNNAEEAEVEQFYDDRN